MNFNLSLNKKITTLSLLGLFIIGILGFTITMYNLYKIEEIKKNTLFSFSENLSDSIQDQFYERYWDVQSFRVRFENQSQTRKENEEFLNNYVAMYGIYDLILLTDLQGNLIAVNTKSPKNEKIDSEQLYSMNFSNDNWFKGVINNDLLNDKEKGFEGVHFEDANFNNIIEKVYGKKVYSTIFSTYVYNTKGEKIGVISTHANFIWVENIFTRLFNKIENKGFSHVEFLMLNKSGEIILDYNPSAQNNKNIVHDSNILNKINLLQYNNEAVKNLQENKEGTGEFSDNWKKTTLVTTYNIVNGPKIADNLNWKILIQENKNEFYKDINKTKYFLISLFLVITISMIIGCILFSRHLSLKLSNIAKKLEQASFQLKDSAENTLNTSKDLSSSSIQQASALQETVAAVTEINSMVARTSDMANQSKITSSQNIKTVEEGKKSIHEMINAIQDIKGSNKNIFNQVDEGNKKISEIVKVINEIESKTKIINEIVFQTKLLSFNASVEAARAGENGRGFAVVAEEVGNLAQMSGSASKEISALIKQSTNKVENIVNEISQKVSELINRSSEKTELGEKISKQCELIFEKILNNSTEIDSLFNEVTNSTNEQSKGISEINLAMHEIDTLTQQNSSAAQSSSNTAGTLVQQSLIINELSKDLSTTITGKKINKEPSDTINKNMNISNQKDSINYENKKTLIQNKLIEKKQETSFTQFEGKVPSANDPRFEDL